MKDIQVFTALDAKTVAAEKLDILLLSTEGAADMAIYNDLEKLKAAFPGKKVAAMADKMFNQDNTLADTLIRKVRVAGIENPQNVGGTASRIEIAFGENMPTETLEASTAYYAKIGGKTVVEITTSEEVPVDCTGLAKLFAGTSFEEDGVKFTAAVDDNTVTYTSTTRTAVSGYAESISLYKDADCFGDMGLSGAVVSVSVGKADTTKAENLIAAIEDLRDHNDDWYFILTDVTDPVCVTALCKWAESTEPTEAALGAGVEDHRKFYFGQTNDKEYVNEYGRSVVTYVLSAESGLLKAAEATDRTETTTRQTTVKDGKEKQEVTYKRECLLNYHLAPADVVKIKSDTLNGNHLIKGGQHTGCPDGDWKTTIEVKPV